MGRTSDAREKILSAAQSLIELRGYSALGVAEICKAADVPKGSFYYFFESKEALALAVIDEHWAGQERTWRRILTGQEAPLQRLRQLFEPLPLPLLFLLDELLQGTNSADRRVGAQGLIHALVERGAIGLISTHDLALTEIAGLEPGVIENVHFQDELVDGKLEFDFKLRPGIVTKSNGIELMRSIGLNV